MEIIYSLFLFFLCSLSKSEANLPPIFTDDMDNFIISESTPAGTVVYQLKGYDPEGSIVSFDMIGTDSLVVDAISGNVTLTKKLDREVLDALQLLVSIRDRINNEFESDNDNIVTVPVSVIILDENDNPPEFQNVPYQVYIPEDVETGMTIFDKIIVTDQDSVGDILDIYCLGESKSLEACFKFSIKIREAYQNKLKASIIVDDLLDFNEKNFYRFILLATDGLYNASTSFEVHITDVQNVGPVFSGPLSAIVNESIPIGALVIKVKAKDGDRGQPRKIVYDIVKNPMDFFTIDSKTGEIRVARPLDREILTDSSVIKLSVRAREVQDDVLLEEASASVQVTISIKDINDSPPTFNQKEYHVILPENTPVGTPILIDMNVFDKDLGNNSIFSLSLDDVSQVFEIEPKVVFGSSSVSIRIANGTLDYENPNHRNFIVLVIAEETLTQNRLSSTATLHIKLVDVNDNPPLFDSETYKASVSELAREGQVIATIKANDADSGAFGEINYSIMGTNSNLFNIDKNTGVLTVSNCNGTEGESPCLDFETQQEYYISVIATDNHGESTGHSSITAVKINIINENDSPLSCENSISLATLQEGATNFDPPFCIKVKDADFLSNLAFYLHDQQFFGIDESSGCLNISDNSKIDLQNFPNDKIEFDVLIQDGKYSVACRVNIFIQDVNNHAPVFLTQNSSILVDENILPGTKVLQVTAHDLDDGLNSKIKYRIQSGSFEDFTIDSDSGTIQTLRKLDFDRKSHYLMVVVAEDQGIPTLSSSTNVTINLKDLNDKEPFLTPNVQRVQVSETTPVGKVIYTMIAMDPDITSLSLLEFELDGKVTGVDVHGIDVGTNSDLQNLFVVEKNGNVVVNQTLQREMVSVINLPIKVSDPTAESQQSSMGSLTILINDINKASPEFLAPWTSDNPTYNLSIKEESPGGYLLFSLRAKDNDSTIAKYEISLNKYFNISNSKGDVFVKSRIDFEEVERIIINVTVYDSGEPQLSTVAILNVTVENINDNDPVFNNTSYKLFALENSKEGTLLGGVHADDLDNDNVSYSISGEDSKYFSINTSTGYIYTKNSTALDKETVGKLAFTASASDGERFSDVSVEVNIIDVNDNSPVFTQPYYNATITENVKLTAAIIQVSAIDMDTGIFGYCKYRILSGNINNTFSLDPENGILFPQLNLAHGFYVIEIEARDEMGNGPHFDRCRVYIEVTQLNQHRPTFLIPETNDAIISMLQYEALKNKVVIEVKAYDADEGESGQFSFFFQENNENVAETNEFSIDKSNGQIKIKKDLSVSDKKQYKIVLVVKDHGKPEFETLRFLTIKLEENSTIPEFEENSMTAFVVENNIPFTKIAKVEAKSHSIVFYYIVQGNDDDLFTIDESTGEIFAKTSLDREFQSTHEIYVKAQSSKLDLKNEPFNISDSNICKVVVQVMDINDNGPEFEFAQYYACVSYQAGINELVAQIKVFDKDYGVNASFELLLVASNLYKFGSSNTTGSIIPSPFGIDGEGRVTTSVYMAEYVNDHFVLEIVAKETVSPERLSKANILVWIFEPKQLIRVIFSRPPSEVKNISNLISENFSNVTGDLIIVDDVRYHIDEMGKIRADWCDLYFLPISTPEKSIRPVEDVLRTIDKSYDNLKDYYALYAIENVVPLNEESNFGKSFDIALAAVVALLILLFVGFIGFSVLCCCLRNWIVSIPAKQEEHQTDFLIQNQIIEDLNTTENPLWIEQKLKLYEEQELTMQVFSEPEVLPTVEISKEDKKKRNQMFLPPDNDDTYATIRNEQVISDTSNYATLSNLQSNVTNTLGFFEYRGSTFQTFQD